ncbi:MAG TPA: hypothetical protein VL426_07885 [Candidatus Binatia bacterium]|nr:hypothetical protein [Candidatus Binatia bacterium]
MSALAAILYPWWAYVLATALSPLWLLAVRRAAGKTDTSPSRRAWLGILLHAVIWLSALLDTGLTRRTVTVLVIFHVMAMLFYVAEAFRHYDAERG